jgi:hypothetical protein
MPLVLLPSALPIVQLNSNTTQNQYSSNNMSTSFNDSRIWNPTAEIPGVDRYLSGVLNDLVHELDDMQRQQAGAQFAGNQVESQWLEGMITENQADTQTLYNMAAERYVDGDDLDDSRLDLIVGRRAGRQAAGVVQAPNIGSNNLSLVPGAVLTQEQNPATVNATCQAPQQDVDMSDFVEFVPDCVQPTTLQAPPAAFNTRTASTTIDPRDGVLDRRSFFPAPAQPAAPFVFGSGDQQQQGIDFSSWGDPDQRAFGSDAIGEDSVGDVASFTFDGSMTEVLSQSLLLNRTSQLGSLSESRTRTRKMLQA